MIIQLGVVILLSNLYATNTKNIIKEINPSELINKSKNRRFFKLFGGGIFK
jgi:hypothetical protein